MDTNATSVVIADSVDHVRSALRLLLCQSQDLIVVGEAANAESAVAQAQQKRPDVVLVEWELPGANGIPVAAVLKAAGWRPAVIATSARPEARRAALAAGADAFVSKLDPPERVLAVMRECVGSEHSPRSARREAEQREAMRRSETHPQGSGRQRLR